MRKLNQNKTGSALATYVVIMFGLIFIMYLFGYTSLWNSFSQTQIQTETTSVPITDPIIDGGINILTLLFNSIANLQILIVIGSAGAAVLLLAIFAPKILASLVPFLIPAFLLIILNIFIFPISGISDALFFADAPFNTAIITGGLIVFFNLFYILAIIEFIRGPS